MAQWYENPAMVAFVFIVVILCCCIPICLCCGKWLLKQARVVFNALLKAVRGCCEMVDINAVNKDAATPKKAESKDDEEEPEKSQLVAVDKTPVGLKNEGRQPGGTRLWWDVCGCCGEDGGVGGGPTATAPPVDPEASKDPSSSKQARLLASLPSATVVRPIKTVSPGKNVDYALDYGVAIPLLSM